MKIEVLELAFTRHVLDLLAESDGVVLAEETEFVERVVPQSALRVAGLVDPSGVLTPAYEAAREEALDRLPVELDMSRRLHLLEVFFELCVIDGELDRGEGSMLFRAAQMLGITPQQFDRHLDGLDDVGHIELDEPLADEGDEA
mgnify:FL=1